MVSKAKRREGTNELGDRAWTNWMTDPHASLGVDSSVALDRSGKIIYMINILFIYKHT